MSVSLFPTHTPETAPEAARPAMIKTAAEFVRCQWPLPGWPPHPSC